MEEELFRLMYEVEDRHWWFRGRAAVVEALIGRLELPEQPRILDAGCGTGRNLQRYARLGLATGIEPSPEAVEFCRRRGLDTVRQGTVEELPFDPASFDLMIATDVIEHTDDDGVALRELRRVAAPGAAMVLTVPAYRWLWSTEDDRLGHRRRYTRASLRQVVTANGWQPVAATYFNTLLLLPIAVARAIRNRGSNGNGGDPKSGEAGAGPRARGSELTLTPGWLDGPLSLPMRLEARLIRAGVRLPAGVSVGIACRPA